MVSARRRVVDTICEIIQSEREVVDLFNGKQGSKWSSVSFHEFGTRTFPTDPWGC